MSLKPVGHLSASVYWRRRVLVFAPILVMLLVLGMCNIGDSGEKSGENSSGETSGGSAEGDKKQTSQKQDGSEKHPYRPTPGPSPSPDAEKPLEENTAENAPEQNAQNSSDSSVCSDDQLSVVLEPEHTSRRVGEQLKIRLRITNTSPDVCTRDIGPGAQEVYAHKGDERVWSSDDCAASSEGSHQKIQAGETLTYWVVWRGARSSGCPDAPESLPPGEYALYGRVGSLVSASATIHLT